MSFKRQVQSESLLEIIYTAHENHEVILKARITNTLFLYCQIHFDQVDFQICVAWSEILHSVFIFAERCIAFLNTQTEYWHPHMIDCAAWSFAKDY